MKNCIYILFLFFTVNTVFGQIKLGQPTGIQQQPNPTGEKLNLVSSSGGIIRPNQEHMTLYNPVFEHKGNTLSADSGYLYENAIKQEFFEAFGNVVITQPSGTVIYSDRLHYDATAQHARLTGNVKMVDRNSTLTTNFLTYNMRSKVGTYTGGGRIISQTDTITSQRAYYYDNTGEAYFSKKVVVRNPSVRVYTDTMRYYSISKNTHFYGPTNIKGNKNENLYTEKGVYNTSTGIANFSKNNLYTEGSKFLKGDSLHYNRVSGFGEAFRNVVFVDTIDKFYAYGGRGVYRQDEESILMTDKPYIITVVKNDSDSTKADSTRIISSSSTAEKPVKKSKKESIETIQSSDSKDLATSNTKEDLIPPSHVDSSPKVDSVYMTADTLFSKMILVRDYKPLDLNLNRDGGELEADEDEDYGDDEGNDLILGNDSLSNKIDIQKDSLTNTLEKPLKKENNISNPVVKKDTVKKESVTAPKPEKKINLGLYEDRKQIANTIKADSILRQKAVVPKLNHADSVLIKALKAAQAQDTIKKNANTSANTSSDTSRTRIVKAFYNVRLFKSDLQAVADSVYYGMQDSMFRFMGKPMIWSQGSQISADTIFMQILNQQMDNALLKDNAFLVNAVLDTVKFNQLKGRKITAFFKNNNIERLFVDGNAENLVFTTDDNTRRVKEMFHDRGARIKVFMENKKIIDYVSIKKVDQKVYPLALVTQENEILPGFIWRPQDRPTSKEDLLNRKRDLQNQSIQTESQNTTKKENKSSSDKNEQEVSEEIEK